MGSTVQQDINVRINAALNGIPAVQTFVGLLQKLKDNGNTKIDVGADASQVNQLTTAVTKLNAELDAEKPSKFAEALRTISSVIQAIAGGAQLLQFLNKGEGALKNVGTVLGTVKDKAGALWESLSARAGPVIESVTAKVSSLAVALPLVGEGGAEAAVGIGAVAAGAGVAVGAVLLVVAAIAALVAIVAVVTTALAAGIPALVKYALGFAGAKISSDDLKQSLIDSLPIHDAYRQKLEASAAKSGDVGKQSRELQGLLFQLRSMWNSLTDAAGGFVDQMAQRVIPIINQFLRVAVHTFDEIMSIIGGLDSALGSFFDFVIFNIENIGKALVWLESRAIATAKGILAAIAVGLATGSVSEGASAFADTFKQTITDLDKIANTGTGFGPGGGRTSGAGATGGGGGGGGGGAKREKILPDISESVFGLNKAEIDAAFNLIKDAFDRQNKLVQEEFDQRKITVKDFYAEQLRIQDAAFGTEIIRLESLLKQEEDKLKTATAKIDADFEAGKLTGGKEEADRKKIIELNQTLAAEATLQGQITKAKRDRDALPHDIELQEKAAVDALNASLQKQIDAMDQLRGIGPLVDARNQVAEIDKLIEQFADNPGMVAMLEEWREIVGSIGQANAALTRFETQQQANEATIATLQERGNRNLVARIISNQKILAIRKQELAALQSVLKEMEAIGAQDQGSLARLESVRTKITQLKNETKTTFQTIKDTLTDALGSGLENLFLSLGDIITGTKTVGQAFAEMALSVIQSLEQVIAKMLVMLIIQKLLGAFAGGGSGVPTPSSTLTSSFLDGFAATGDFFSAKVGGRIIRVAEGGHDEVVLTTDPAHRNRTAGLLALFLQKTQMLKDMATGGWLSAEGLSQNVLSRIPSFDAGGFALSGSGVVGGLGGDTFHLGGVQLVFPNVKDARGFKLNESAIHREVSRAVESSTRKLRGARD